MDGTLAEGQAGGRPKPRGGFGSHGRADDVILERGWEERRGEQEGGQGYERGEARSCDDGGWGRQE